MKNLYDNLASFLVTDYNKELSELENYNKWFLKYNGSVPKEEVMNIVRLIREFNDDKKEKLVLLRSGDKCKR